jgi:UDP-N-acetylglucosamine 2-epimerase (hydrolysing)
MKKNITFLTGTRADFGKIKSLIDKLVKSEDFNVNIFVTGMHLQKKYGYTVNEILSHKYENVYQYMNHGFNNRMEINLSKTIDGFSSFIQENPTDLVVIHGDRSEALAGAVVGAFNNILVAHIEGGEVSGTIDELIRHSVSKMSHIHFVSNDFAKKRLIQMGEKEKNIFVIGSPDLDIMFSKNLPTLVEVKEKYEFSFEEYGVVMFHPVTTELENIDVYSKNLISSLIESELNYIVIYPNNDMGSYNIIENYSILKKNEKFKIYPSIRLEYFLVLLKNSKFIIGNSSAGIREAPYYNIPTVNIGTRQNNRSKYQHIIHSDYKKSSILSSIKKALKQNSIMPENHFGFGNSAKLFLNQISKPRFWKIDKQKTFNDI